MNDLDGTDLASLLVREGPLEPRRALELVRQIADALDNARWSRGHVHGSLEPACIVVSLDEEGNERVDVTGFGSGAPGANPNYLAPEQIEGGPVSARSDVYALGCILYECLTGAAPFRRGSRLAVLAGHLHGEPVPPRDRRAYLPVGFGTVIAKALAKSPEERYSTCGELAAAAQAELGGIPCV